MKCILTLFSFFLLLGCTSLVEDTLEKPSSTSANALDTPILTIAEWNLQIFGDSKASKPELVKTIANLASKYDVIIFQEIRDKDGSAIQVLCSQMVGYECVESSRAGRSSTKEQYVVAFRRGINLSSFYDFNPDASDRWERPPFKFRLFYANRSIDIYTIHIDPDTVAQEVGDLEKVVDSDKEFIVIGDLNMDCVYYNSESQSHFKQYYWVIKDTDDTTTGDTDCAYDRIITNAPYITTGGVDVVPKEVSDHNIVWVEIG